jgi:hypothetical protein
MQKSWLFPLVLLSALTTKSADAFFDPPYITPAMPTVGETISVNVHGGGCDAIIGQSGYPQITQVGNAIRVLFFSAHYDDPEFCNLGEGTATRAIGTYPAGSYTLQVDRTYIDFFGNLVVGTLGSSAFTVTGGSAPAVPAPSLDSLGLGILGLMLFGIAGRRLRSNA